MEPPPSAPESVAGDAPALGGNKTTIRRNANGSISSVYSGNKIRHIKKEDGVPLWRKDIQYDFLKFVFYDTHKVFHKASDGTFGHTFADIYLDAMAKSSKCSKILKDKLLTDRPAALNMAMVCLLVNVGRMNTTLNFFPEMRAQLRTYHSIPSLQAHQDPNAYKQLQDAPRLKSILKGATEDTEQPSTLEDIKNASIPRTNPVNLIFVLSLHALKISEMHFDVPRDFFDLVMRPTLSSRSRATAFLWLMWWYLESDFSSADALRNPFGPGRRSNKDADEREMPIKCPQFDYLSEAEADLENMDTPEEKEFGEAKRLERMSILQTDMAPVITGPKRTSKKGAALNSGIGVFSMASDNDGAVGSDFGSPAPSAFGARRRPPASIKDENYDSDRTRSASPTGSHAHTQREHPKSSATGMRLNILLNDDVPSPSPVPAAPAATTTPAPAPKGPGRGNWGHRRRENQLAAAAAAAAAAANGEAGLTVRPHGFYIPLNGQIVEPKRSRPLTVHQQAVERYRTESVNYILDRGMRDARVKVKRRREKDSVLGRAWKRCKALPDMYDSEEEVQSIGAQAAGGNDTVNAARALVMMASLRPCGWEASDWGEEAAMLASGLRKVRRRTGRWESGAEVVRKKKVKKGKAASNGVAGATKEEEEEEEGREEGKMDVDEGMDRSSLPDVDGDGEPDVDGDAEPDVDGDAEPDEDGDDDEEGDYDMDGGGTPLAA